MIPRIVIIGIPGSGKTTLAAGLAAEFDLSIVSAGDVGRRVSPERIARGEMAEESALLAGVLAEIAEHRYGWILDGFPRTAAQARMLPDGCSVINLTVRHDVAIERQMLRARPGDTAEIIVRRTEEQTQLMEVEVPEGWAYTLAGYGRSMNTTRVSRSNMIAQVVGHLRGERREVY